jgi:hypothetical protein
VKAEAQEGQERSSRGLLGIWLCWLGAAVILYVLSSGPFWLMADKKIIRMGTPAWRAAQIVYYPLDWVYAYSLLHKPIGMYWHFWAPGRFDAKGNIRRRW